MNQAQVSTRKHGEKHHVTLHDWGAPSERLAQYKGFHKFQHHAEFEEVMYLDTNGTRKRVRFVKPPTGAKPADKSKVK